MRHAIGTKLLLYIAIITVAVVALVYGYIFYKTGLLIQDSAQARQAVVSATVSKSHEQAFMQMYQSTADSWAKLPALFVQPDKFVSFIEAVEYLGTESGTTVTIASVNVDDGTHTATNSDNSLDNLKNAAAGTLGSVSAHVGAQGSWTAVMRTLQLAEVMPFNVTISNVQLDVDTSGGKTAARSWHLSFDVKADIVAMGKGQGVASSTVTTH